MFTYTNANGRTINEHDVNVEDIFEIRWLRDPAPRWMGLHREIGIPFNRLTAMRESAEYRQSAMAYLHSQSVPLSASNLRHIGVKAAEQSRTVEEQIVEAVTQSTMAAYTTKYGVEIEFLSLVSQSAIEQAVNEAGVTCRNENYNHRLRGWWKVVYDGSVSGTINGEPARGLEIVSPPLTGEEGFRQVEVVCEVLDRLGCKVNRKCGLHVHIEASDLSLKEMRNVCVAWAQNEHIIDSIVPNSRKGRNNSYCNSILSANRTNNYECNALMHKIQCVRSKQRLVKVMCPNGRFYKLNLKALARHGTLEFRYHSGTMDAKKINQHIRFCAGFVTQYKRIDCRNAESPTLNVEMDTSEMLNVIAGAVNDNEREQFINHFSRRQRQLAA